MAAGTDWEHAAALDQQTAKLHQPSLVPEFQKGRVFDVSGHHVRIVAAVGDISVRQDFRHDPRSGAPGIAQGIGRVAKERLDLVFFNSWVEFVVEAPLACFDPAYIELNRVAVMVLDQIFPAWSGALLKHWIRLSHNDQF